MNTIRARALIRALRRKVTPRPRAPAWLLERLARPPLGLIVRPYPICEIDGCDGEAVGEAQFGARVLFVCEEHEAAARRGKP